MTLALVIGAAFVFVVVLGVVIKAMRGGGGGYDPLAPTGSAASTGTSMAMPSAIDVKPSKGAAAASGGARQPGSSVTANGRTWRVLSVYTYEEDGERWEERRVRDGASEGWLATDERGTPVLFDRRWDTSDFPTQQSATMPDGSMARRVEAGSATFTAVGEHDGWADGQVAYASYRADDGTNWSFELDDEGAVEAWSGTTTVVNDA